MAFTSSKEVLVPWANAFATEIHECVDPTVNTLRILADDTAIPQDQRLRLKTEADRLEDSSSMLVGAVGLVLLGLPDVMCGFCKTLARQWT